MKISPKETERFLSTALSVRSVLIYGPDEGLGRQYRQQLLNTILSSPQDPMSVTQLTSEQVAKEPHCLFEAMSSISLLGESPAVIIEQASDKISPVIKDALSTEACQNFLLVLAGDLPARSSLRSLYEKDKTLASIACYKDEKFSLEKFIRQYLNDQMITYDRDCLHYLSTHLGNDRGVTQSELDKIILYLGDEKTLSLSIAEQLTGGNNHHTMDDLCLSVMNGNLAVACSLYERCLLEGTQEIAILRMFTRYLMRLKTARLAIDQGQSADQAMNQLRPPVFFKQKDSFKQHLSRYSVEILHSFLGALLQAERQIKHGQATERSSLHCITAITQRCASLSYHRRIAA